MPFLDVGETAGWPLSFLDMGETPECPMSFLDVGETILYTEAHAHAFSHRSVRAARANPRRWVRYRGPNRLSKNVAPRLVRGELPGDCRPSAAVH